MKHQDLLPQLHDISARLESVFEDMCDFDFTVQDGKLYLLSARPAKRSPAAALRIATDLFLEGKIAGTALVSRIDPTVIEEILKPAVIINSNIRELGKGLPASSGAAMGAAAFSADSIVRLTTRGIPAVFLCNEMTPEDIGGLEASVGVVSFLGGMTSHAAIVSRGMRKPCVSAVHWSFDSTGNVVVPHRGKIREGDPLTLDGTTGTVYAGSADVKSPKALENDRLLLLLRLIDTLSAEDSLPQDHVGRVWLIRDIMQHDSGTRHRQDPEHRLKRWQVSAGAPGKAYGTLGSIPLQQFTEELLLFQLNHHHQDHVEIWRGLRTCLFRLLSKHAGIGRHPGFCRPLFDPCQAVLDTGGSRAWGCRSGHRVQLLGEEFFSVNYHVPELIDIATIRLYWAVECKTPAELWRSDRTNPAGERLLEGSADVMALKIMINDAPVSQSLLPAVYNSLRRREYFWNWHCANRVSRREIVDFMTKRSRIFSRRVRELAERARLVSPGGEVTLLGESLLHSSTATERARLPIRVGW
jgi:phosphohistidine swiveling domain-containing protein